MTVPDSSDVRDPIANVLNGLHGAPYDCRLGDGTALSARWRHRDSFDIDLTVATRANLRSLPDDLEETMRRLGGDPEYWSAGGWSPSTPDRWTSPPSTRGTPANAAMASAVHRHLTTVDCVNVLRAGVVDPPELESGTWRYRVRGGWINVVVAFRSEDTLVVITAWRTG